MLGVFLHPDLMPWFILLASRSTSFFSEPLTAAEVYSKIHSWRRNETLSRTLRTTSVFDVPNDLLSTANRAWIFQPVGYVNDLHQKKQWSVDRPLTHPDVRQWCVRQTSLVRYPERCTLQTLCYPAVYGSLQNLPLSGLEACGSRNPRPSGILGSRLLFFLSFPTYMVLRPGS